MVKEKNTLYRKRGGKWIFPVKGEMVPRSEIRRICENFRLSDLWFKIDDKSPDKPFKSDGCSCWFDSWDGVDMYPACFLHDLKYWVGGTDTERLIADAELMIDIAKLGLPEMAQVMFAGVRAGGGNAWKKTYKWGGGYRYKSRRRRRKNE